MSEFDQTYWEGHYRDHAAADEVMPSPWLVTEIGDLPGGAALDAGCGEGANAIWLASAGWQVTAVDFAPTVLRRAMRRAASLGPELAGRISWLAEDLTVWVPAREHFDLVCAHYVHPAAARGALLGRLADAVVAGGTLLLVDHDALDQGSSLAHTRVSAADLARGLDPAEWDIEVAEARTRSGNAGEHHQHTFRDAVLRAHKRF